MKSGRRPNRKPNPTNRTKKKPNPRESYIEIVPGDEVDEKYGRGRFGVFDERIWKKTMNLEEDEATNECGRRWRRQLDSVKLAICKKKGIMLLFFLVPRCSLYFGETKKEIKFCPVLSYLSLFVP